MARRDKRHPALRGDQVSRWLEKGILKAAQIGDTTILVVHKAARVRLTPRYITTISQGIFLVPRWVKIPWGRWTAELRDLPAKEIEARAIIASQDGQPHRLIYQQVEDLDHLCRQQKHILANLGEGFFEKYIKPHIVGRKRAAQVLRWTRELQLRRDRERIALLGRKLHRPELMTPEAIEEALLTLDEVITALDEIIERPLVTRRKRAQRSLQCAQRWIEEERFNLAIERLRSAWKNLTWPDE